MGKNPEVNSGGSVEKGGQGDSARQTFVQAGEPLPIGPLTDIFQETQGEPVTGPDGRTVTPIILTRDESRVPPARVDPWRFSGKKPKNAGNE